MLAFTLKRLALALLQLALVCLLVFAMLRLIPGDPALVILGSEQTPPPEVLEAVRNRLGLDKPLVQQFLDWAGALLRLDLGRSLRDDYPVYQEVAARLPRTLELIGWATLLASLLGVPAGIQAALQRNRWPDRLLGSIFSLGLAIPPYVIGTFLVLVFSVENGWLPGSGYTPVQDDPIRHYLQLILPSLTLTVGLTAIIGRMARSALLEVLGEDYVRTAHSKGLPATRVLYRHALRNALIPIVTVIGLQFGTLIGGTVLVENIFSWPGLSTLLVTAARQRDYPMVQGAVLTAAVAVILIQTLIDLLYGLANPKLRYS